MLLIPALRRQKQTDLGEFRISLVYIVNFTSLGYIVRACLKRKKRKKNNLVLLSAWSTHN